MSLRETLKVVAKTKGVMPEEGINPMEPAEAGMHVWSWFCSLMASRQNGMDGGPQRLTNQEVLAFFTIEGIVPEGWETKALRLLDMASLKK